VPPSTPADDDEDSSKALRDFEAMVRARTDFAHLPASDTTLGADPYSLRRLPAPPPTAAAPRFVGILRGASVVVLLDDALHELARLDAPASPSSLAVSADGHVFVAGELSHAIQRYHFTGTELEANGTIDLPDVLAIRGLAVGPEGVLYVVEEHDGRLLTLELGEAGRGGGSRAPIAFRRFDSVVGHGPLRVARVGRYVLVDCLLDHALVVRRVDRDGVPEALRETRIVHDGPIWGFDAVETPSDEGGAPGLLVAAGGVEDHPLDRSQGSFGFVDSFAYLYRVSEGTATRLAQINTSALGLVTPKALSIARDPGGSVEVIVAAYGSNTLAHIVWARAPEALPGATGDATPGAARDGVPEIATFACPPGSAAMERCDDGSLAIANPLLDAWIHVTLRGGGGRVEIVRTENRTSPTEGKERTQTPPSAERSIDSRLGEALFFTSLIAPWNSSEGRLSRFACEACHFEGYVDGRTHRTGRGDVLATTKPLLGLFNNKPYFSRALDPDLAAVADNEFRVAGARSGHDPRFSLTSRDVPWLAELGAGDTVWSPDDLRRALMTFLMSLSHRPNPAVLGRSGWSSDERAGAALFRDRCESCHAARFVADDPSTRVPFERWESLVMAREGPIVWARAEYAKTGVLPYVHEKGARIPSLRRLFKKYPYFTNGTAKSLAAVLDRVRYGATAFFHDGVPQGATMQALTRREEDVLLEFLNLL
jgi:hypothetical protein